MWAAVVGLAVTPFAAAQAPAGKDIKDEIEQSEKAATVFREIMDIPDKAIPNGDPGRRRMRRHLSIGHQGRFRGRWKRRARRGELSHALGMERAGVFQPGRRELRLADWCGIDRLHHAVHDG